MGTGNPGISAKLFLRDYVRDPRRSPEEIGEALLSLEEKEAMNPEKLLSTLGLDELDPDIPLAARGYRILSKIPAFRPQWWKGSWR